MSNRFWNTSSFQLETGVVRLYARLTFGAVEVDQITLPAKASATDGDYFVIHDWQGGSWAVALDTAGTASNTPTGAAWVAVPAANKVYLDISGTTTAASVSTAVHTALLALTGFTTVLTAVTSTVSQNVTNTGAGVVVAPTVYSKAGAAGTGSITKSVTTAGTASTITSAKGFTTSFTQNSKGKYTLTLGGTDPVTGRNALDTYYKVLHTGYVWDATGNSGTAPLAPLAYLTANAVGTAGSASFQLTCNTVAQAVANPAAGEALFVEIHLGNSNTLS